MRYKANFSRFDFYGSFIVDKTKIMLSTDLFAFHVEGMTTAYPMGRFVHVYSLPFTFNKLYGFSSCSNLPSQTSFFTVRYLYFTRTLLDRSISFDSLSKRMPHLQSIDYHYTFVHDDNNMIAPKVKPIQETFTKIRSLHFESHCWKHCSCVDFLGSLIDQMPQLQSLTTSHYPFSTNTKTAPTIKRLDLRKCHLETFNLLPQHVPNLKMLFLGCELIHSRDICQVIGPLFLNIPSLRLIYSPLIYTCGLDRTPYGKYKQDALTQLRNMDSRLSHLKCGSQYDGNTYYLSNS